MKKELRYILKVAALSRTVVFGLQAIFNLLPDHEADAFNPETSHDIGILDHIVRNSLDGFDKWDAKYFIFIAEHGYKEEQMYAFFPLFPLTVRSIATMLEILPVPLSYHSCLLLSGIILNSICFVGSVAALYHLTLQVYKDERFAVLSAVAHCFNPASIFFSTNYTESLYAFCVFQALVFLEEGSLTKSTLLFMFASATRSNGIVNAGFPIYNLIFQFVIQNILHGHLDVMQCKIQSIIQFSRQICKAFVMTLAIILPFTVVNIIGYQQFCGNVHYMSDGDSDWCHGKVPILYSHIQSAHWGVGFFKYYKIRKIPNIILALPCIILTTYGVHEYLFSIFSQSNRKKLQLASKDIFVYVVHVLFLCLFGILFMHVEVITRFIFSSSPFPCWVTASILMTDLKKSAVPYPCSFSTARAVWGLLQPHSKLLCIYFATYVSIGTLLHVNFLPWT